MIELLNNDQPAPNWEGLRAEQILERTLAEFGRDAALSCSFGGPSGMALVHMAARMDPSVRVITLDTGFLFPETYDLIQRVEAKYGISVERAAPALSPDEQSEWYGDALWKTDPDACCRIRKVEPMREATKGLRAWVTGIRRDQSETRRNTPIARWDEKFGLLKVAPLAAWTEADVWTYVMANDVPYNPLHDRQYASIGCTHCTRPIQIGEDLRAGRWAGAAKTECGLHH
ncbi:MAG TPA: phosphoadenylyl-sulfate reductase [Armatimonadota bacterium]|jgi:phosphoadenosine phosphosulfate reductase